MKTKITMRAIAKSAGVSLMTVSRALRGEPNVDPVKAAKIWEVAKVMGYRRNQLVSAVMSTLRGVKQPLCSPVIAYLTADSASFRPEQRLASQLYLRGAQKMAAESGFTVEEFVMEPTQASSKLIALNLFTRNIRGLLIGPLCRSCGHLSLNWKEFSSSAISINLVRPDLDRCSIDSVQSVSVAIRNLKRLGYRRIGYGISPFHVALSHHRSRAMYLDYQCELPAGQRVGLITDWTLPGFLKWLKTDRPDAIIGHGDEILSWLNALGVGVPSHIGYVDINIFDGTHVPLAGVVFDYESIGATAVSMVIGKVLRNNFGLPQHPVHCYIQGYWRSGPTVRAQQPFPSSNEGKKARGLPKNDVMRSGAEPFHSRARDADFRRWRFLDLRRLATHSYTTRGDISKWEEGLGLLLSPGRQEINAVPFRLIDEKANKRKGYVLLQKNASVTIPVGHECEAIFFLIAAGFVASHGPIAEIVYKWADGKEELQPLVAYFTSSQTPETVDQWESESGVQDWWPSFPHFRNQSAKAFRVGGDDQSPVEWRYLYTLERVNLQSKVDLTSVTIRHLQKSESNLAILSVTTMIPA